MALSLNESQSFLTLNISLSVFRFVSKLGNFFTITLLLLRIFSTICRAYKKQSVYLLKMPNYQRQIGFFENVFVICVMLSLVNKMFPKYNFLYCQYLSLELPCIIQNKAKIYFLRQRVLISKIGIFFTFSEAHHLLCRDL